MSFSFHIPVEIINGKLSSEHFFINEKFVISADAILIPSIFNLEIKSTESASIGVIIKSNLSFLHVRLITE